MTVFGLLQAPVPGPDTKVASAPPMGWNSWNTFRDKIDDATVRAQADAWYPAECETPDMSTSTLTHHGKGTRRKGVLHPNSKFS